MTYFSGSKVFGCFEKHPKVVSGALRGGFRAREVFGSFEKRTPGMTFDQLIFAGKIEKQKHSGTYFFSGVNKRLL